jgi:hypothetical protein
MNFELRNRNIQTKLLTASADFEPFLKSNAFMAFMAYILHLN